MRTAVYRPESMRLINLRPSPGGRAVLAALPFLLLLAVYLVSSQQRLHANPDDKLLPSFATLAASVHEYAFVEDERSGQLLWWTDSRASLQRLLTALGVASGIGLGLGLLIGAVPHARALLAPFIAALSMIPPLAILPVLFIVFGLDEGSKILLIVIGITPTLVRDLAQRAAELPQEQLIKAQTLGASSWTVVTRVLLPQLLPRLIDSLRLSLGAAWLFLIAAEAIASTDGLGYRIFLVRRYLAMDVILPYVVWITLLAFGMDWLLRHLRARAFPWAEARA